MRIPWKGKLCEGLGVSATRRAAQSVAAGWFFNRVAGPWRSAELYSAVSRICDPPVVRDAVAVPNAIRRYSRLKICAATGAALVLVLFNYCGAAQSTNNPANDGPSDPPRVESPAHGLDESAFRVVPERNIFNANRSGGTVRGPSQRPARIEFFTLVGTMAYEKGAFAFFEGSNSEFTKVMKTDGVIAGHKLMDIHASSVKIEADGKEIELPVGSQMRREDEGTWHLAESSRGGGASNPSSRNGDSSSRNSRSGRAGDSSSRSRRDGESSRGRSENPAETSTRSSSNTSTSSADPAEILKRLMERREKESQ